MVEISNKFVLLNESSNINQISQFQTLLIVFFNRLQKLCEEFGSCNLKMLTYYLTITTYFQILTNHGDSLCLLKSIINLWERKKTQLNNVTVRQFL